MVITNTKGYVPLERRIILDGITNNPKILSVYINLLLLADYKTNILIITQEQLAEMCGLSRQNVRTALHWLEDHREIELGYHYITNNGKYPKKITKIQVISSPLTSDDM